MTCGDTSRGHAPAHSGNKDFALRVALACLSFASLVPSATAAQCDGFDEEFAVCAGLPMCLKCDPVACEFSAWSNWVDHGGCSGLKARSRSIKTVNNECGAPCQGPMMESAKSVKEECGLTVQDCVLGKWAEWTNCSAIAGKGSQQNRFRAILQNPENGGKPCDNALKETRACSGLKEVAECTFMEWQEWTECSTTCGMGHHTRLRRTCDHNKLIITKPCEGSTLQTAPCTVTECPTTPCELTEWNDWSTCDPLRATMKYRERQIKQNAAGAGEPCEGCVAEAKPCAEVEVDPCKVGEWTEWEECDRPCGGGQTYRKRRVLSSQVNGGSCPDQALEETRSCNSKTCSQAESCLLSAWSTWGACDVPCGNGTSTRTREVAQEAKNGGNGCEGGISEIMPCQAKGVCQKQDCLWGEWDRWSDCSSSCGSGTQNHNRYVKQAPSLGGAPCAANVKSEVQSCNTQSCDIDVCRPGKWSEWSVWSECSMSCDVGVRSRDRRVMQPPDSCAPAMEGTRSEIAACDLPKCVQAQDCELSEWIAWSACSCSCYGIKERSRVIDKFPLGDGKPCQGNAVKQIAPCNQGGGECGRTERRDCVLSAWGARSACSRTCGGGQRQLARHVEVGSQGGGNPCEGDLVLLEPCGTETCDKGLCENCKFAAWSAWSECQASGNAAHGQTSRHRVIEQLPNHCGKPCEQQSTQEMKNCSMPLAELLVCRWTKWTAPTSCKAQCTPGEDCCDPFSATTSRVLGFQAMKDAEVGNYSFKNVLFNASESSTCSGSQLAVEECQDWKPCKPCERKDCVWAKWTEWTAPLCLGLCERTRTIKQQNNECGNPCVGNVIETKRCPVMCEDPIDGVWGEWEEWNTCNDPKDQTTRQRHIKIFAEKGGKPVVGSQAETGPCVKKAEMSDCKLGEWETWTTCQVECNGGTKERRREVVVHADGGGMPCNGSLTAFAECNTQSCTITTDTDCEWSQWSMWSGCDSQNQRYMYRKVVKPATGKGVPCHGPLEKIGVSCVQKKDCVVSSWTPWDACDKPCGGGQHHRQRQIQVFPIQGGEHCPSDLSETQGCNQQSCDFEDCTATAWSTWSACSASCGVGQRGRIRHLEKEREEGGVGCTFPLAEVEGCMDKECAKKDCEWGEWETWGACSCLCDGGHKVRTRHITQHAMGGGAPCKPKDQEEVAPCNTQSCNKNAVDGEWDQWTEWSQCSVDCGGGTTGRERKVKVMANEWGSAPAGMDREVHFCNTGSCSPSVDCLFNDWALWSDCTATCYGIKSRSRTIARMGSGEGKFCVGAVKQNAPCYAAGETSVSDACKPVSSQDCELLAWQGWSDCTKTCGGGSKTRSRGFGQLPVEFGASCDGVTTEDEECARAPCEGPTPQDCVLGDWQVWGACGKCNGAQKRVRDVMTYPSRGGKACEELSELEQVQSCKITCGQPTFCTWNGWGAWSGCSSTCGAATKNRRRTLMEGQNATLAPIQREDLLNKYNLLLEGTKELEVRLGAGHAQELAASFAAGGISLVAMLSVWRIFRGSSNIPSIDSEAASLRTFDRMQASEEDRPDMGRPMLSAQ